MHSKAAGISLPLLFCSMSSSDFCEFQERRAYEDQFDRMTERKEWS